MQKFDCGKYVTWGFVAGLVAWAIFIATLAYAAYFVPDVAAQTNQLFTQRSGLQAGGFITGWWLAVAGLALCITGYFKEFKGPNCLLGVAPAALYVANPWSAVIFLKFIGT
jgi:hypothetical protein